MRRERAYTAVAVMLDIGWYAGRQRLESAGDIARSLSDGAGVGSSRCCRVSPAPACSTARAGPKGGYRLGKSARQITLAEVVEAVTTGDGVEPVESEAGGELQSAAVEPLWAELEQHAQTYLHNITLEALIQRAQSQGLKRPAPRADRFSRSELGRSVRGGFPATGRQTVAPSCQGGEFIVAETQLFALGPLAGGDPQMYSRCAGRIPRPSPDPRRCRRN